MLAEIFGWFPSTLGSTELLRSPDSVAGVKASQPWRLFDIFVGGPFWIAQGLRKEPTSIEHLIRGLGAIGYWAYNMPNYLDSEKHSPEVEEGFDGVHKSQGYRAFGLFATSPFWFSQAFRPDPTTAERAGLVGTGLAVVVLNGINYAINTKALKDFD